MKYWILNVALEPRSFLCILPNIKEEINERREGIESQNKHIVRFKRNSRRLLLSIYYQ